jgi:hypothetical protein
MVVFVATIGLLDLDPDFSFDLTGHQVVGGTDRSVPPW